MKWVIFLALGVLVGVSFLPVEATQPTPFADPSFSRFFAQAGASGQKLLWGGAPLVSLVEPYADAAGSRRLVQYFDRGRMELDAATGAVTQGLLVRELTSGAVQVGDDAFTQRSPANIPIMATSANAGQDAGPTYADFAVAALSRSPNRTVSPDGVLDDWLLPGGKVLTGPVPVVAIAAIYVDVTGHNVPDVFAAWFATEPFGTLSWQQALGYPVSEAYWVQADGADHLVQLFERRVVVYTPRAASSEQFAVTNVGRHYFRWRYGDEPGEEQRRLIAEPAADVSADLVAPLGYSASVVLTNVTDITDLAIGPDSRVLIAHASGTISALAPGAGAEVPLVSGLQNPVAVASVGSTIYVVDSAGLHRFEDLDADGIIDVSHPPIALPFDPATVIAAPGPNECLYIGGVEATHARSGFATVMRWDAVTEQLDLVPVTFSANAAFVLDVSGSIWAADADGELVRFTLNELTRGVLSLQGIAAPTPTADTARAATLVRAIRDLLLYRPDGTIGDPLRDMLALVSDADGGRLVRLQPAAADASATATPASDLAGSIVDFVTGFRDPVAVVAGLDGSLYVADDGRAVLYRITPQ